MDRSESTTVYRSADSDAESDARRVHARLKEEGLDATLASEDQPGVVIGTWEVRVPAAQGASAERIIDTMGGPEVAGDRSDETEGESQEAGDNSHEMDPVTVFQSAHHDAEMEALSVVGLLEANGIPSVLAGSPQIPSLPFAVLVPRSYQAEAERVLAEARAAGSSAADEAEAESER